MVSEDNGRPRSMMAQRIRRSASLRFLAIGEPGRRRLVQRQAVVDGGVVAVRIEGAGLARRAKLPLRPVDFMRQTQLFPRYDDAATLPRDQRARSVGCGCRAKNASIRRAPAAPRPGLATHQRRRRGPRTVRAASMPMP